MVRSKGSHEYSVLAALAEETTEPRLFSYIGGPKVVTKQH